MGALYEGKGGLCIVCAYPSGSFPSTKVCEYCCVKYAKGSAFLARPSAAILQTTREGGTQARASDADTCQIPSPS